MSSIQKYYSINRDIEGEYSWVNNRPLFASISGGKDSTALGIHLKELGLKFTPIFIDTGWEHPDTYTYIREVLIPLFGDFIILRNEKFFDPISPFAGGMEQLVAKKKVFPNGRMKFCTHHLKIIPIQNFYSEVRIELGAKPINAIGIRAEESQKRSTMGEFEEQDEADVWRPLIKWTYEEVIRRHQSAEVLPNPQYVKGYSRVGCNPCIFARKHEIRHMALSEPARIDHIEDLERRISGLRSDGQQATFFKSRKKEIDKMGIREIVKWSKTKKKETLDDLEELEEAGCMRWGLCESPTVYNIEEQIKEEEFDLFNWYKNQNNQGN